MPGSPDAMYGNYTRRFCPSDINGFHAVSDGIGAVRNDPREIHTGPRPVSTRCAAGEQSPGGRWFARTHRGVAECVGQRGLYPISKC